MYQVDLIKKEVCVHGVCACVRVCVYSYSHVCMHMHLHLHGITNLKDMNLHRHDVIFTIYLAMYIVNLFAMLFVFLERKCNKI